GLGGRGIAPGPVGTANVPAAPPTTTAGESQLSAPVTFRSRSIARLKSRAEASSDPATRARLLERARRGHQKTLEELAAAVKKRGKFKLTEQLDGYELLARTKDVAHLFEVKTWTPANLTSQIRRGWAQLREYRYRNAAELPADVRLYLVFDRPPPRELWIWDFLAEDCGVVPLWVNDGELRTLPSLAKQLPSSLIRSRREPRGAPQRGVAVGGAAVCRRWAIAQ